MIHAAARTPFASIAFAATTIAATAAAIGVAIVAAASPAAAFDPDATFMIAHWDGRDTDPGLWFEIDGAPPPPTVRLARVRFVPEGLEVRAEAGRLTLSSALARLLDVAPGVPALIAFSAAMSADPVDHVRGPVGDPLADPRADPLALDSDDPRALAAEGRARDEGAASYAALTDHIARIEDLFGAMRVDAERGDAAALSTAARRDAVAEAAPAVVQARRGGLVSYLWREDAP